MATKKTIEMGARTEVGASNPNDRERAALVEIAQGRRCEGNRGGVMFNWAGEGGDMRAPTRASKANY